MDVDTWWETMQRDHAMFMTDAPKEGEALPADFEALQVGGRLIDLLID